MNFSAYNLPFGSYNLKIDLLKDQVLGKNHDFDDPIILK